MTALRAARFERNPIAASRTDLGVHARMQVLSLRVVESVSAEEVGPRLNPHLPPGVGIACSRPARVGTPTKFNAAWDVTTKQYRYRLLLEDRPEWAPFAWRLQGPLDLARVNELLRLFVGQRTYAAFHDKGSTVKPRTIGQAELVELGGGLFEARLTGTGFGRYMIRYLVGAIIDVVRGVIPLEVFMAGLEDARPFVRARAPAAGLTLWQIDYAAEVDPFSGADRHLAAGVPESAPFV
jgi:tRNA pseudouridine38-40 synthase